MIFLLQKKIFLNPYPQKKLSISQNNFLRTYGSTIRMAIQITDPYEPYGLLICRYVIFFLHSSPFPMTKTDQNLPYTPHKCTYTTKDQYTSKPSLREATYTK